MKKKALKKLSKALRSGEFKQYRGCCFDEKTGGFCVFGVANNIFGGLSGKNQVDQYSLTQLTVQEMGAPQSMPYFLGLPFHALNDGGRINNEEVEALSFDELADLIDIALLDGPNKYFHKKGSYL